MNIDKIYNINCLYIGYLVVCLFISNIIVIWYGGFDLCVIGLSLIYVNSKMVDRLILWWLGGCGWDFIIGVLILCLDKMIVLLNEVVLKVKGW